jgi:hypothetical protein
VRYRGELWHHERHGPHWEGHSGLEGGFTQPCASKKKRVFSL